MGNNQSVVGRHNRLTKPKTNTNSPPQLYDSSSPVSISSRYADLSAKGRLQIRESLLSPVGEGLSPTVGSSKDDDGTGADPSPRIRGRPMSMISRSNSRAPSRTNSRSNSLSCFGSRRGSSSKLADLQGSNASVDMDAAIRLLQEVKKNGSPEDLAALHEALQSPSDTTVPDSEQGLSRRNSGANRSSSSLMRRRSLIQTPGIATRNSPVDGRRRTWNSWKAPTLAPDEEAKWLVTPKGIAPVHRTPERNVIDTSTPRAQTPRELEYSHLGSLQLGSLSIVNGAPSPAGKQKSRTTEDNDYFSGTEDSSPLTMKPTRVRGHVKSKSAVLPSTVPLYEHLRSSEEKKAKRYQPTLPNIQTNQNGRHYTAQSHLEKPPHGLQCTNADIEVYAHYAEQYAHDYQVELPASPFRKSHDICRNPKQASPASEQNTGLKKEANHALAGTMFDAPTTAIEASGSVLFSPVTPTTDKPKSKAIQRPPPRTADSGYSSGGSLRVAHREQKRGESPPGLSEAAIEERPAQEVVTSLPVNPDDSSPLSMNVKETVLYRRPTSLLLSRLSARSLSSDGIISPNTPHSLMSKSSFDSTNSTTNKRLQKRRPSHSELPVVQSCQSIPEGTIPAVPAKVRAQFTRRLSHTPGIECLTHTYPSKDHELAADTHVVADNELYVQAAPQLAELEPEQAPKPPMHERKRSLSLFRKRSSVKESAAEKMEDPALTDIVDLGTIASSLGSSPYDAAMSQPLRSTVTSPTHPHQLGGAIPRAKSMVSMDSQAAAEFARMRSKDRALAEQQVPPARRRSYHNLKADAGEARASKRRPRSALYDVPPVPTIDTAKINVPHSATPRLENDSKENTFSDMASSTRSNRRSQVPIQPNVRQDRHEQHNAQQKLNWDSHSRAWAQRRKSVGEGLRSQAGFGEATASTINSRNARQSSDSMATWGRYSGGLDYAYEGRGAGVGGSAGTRQLHSAASMKSMKWRNDYGVDLSDVPIIVQRA